MLASQKWDTRLMWVNLRRTSLKILHGIRRGPGLAHGCHRAADPSACVVGARSPLVCMEGRIASQIWRGCTRARDVCRGLPCLCGSWGDCASATCVEGYQAILLFIFSFIYQQTSIENL